MKQTGPDSLHSWIVASGCCFINTMMFGMARLSGVLFVASMSSFHIAREQASFPYTLAPAIRNASGPLVGYLGHKLGVRLVTLSGCVLGAFGIAMCFLAEDVSTVTVLWGVLFGLGFGLGNVLLPVSINQYFDKKRSAASGLSFSGACIGSFVLPPIVEILINAYGLSGTFLILAGFLLNCLPAALLLSKPNFVITSSKQNAEKFGEKQNITQGSKYHSYTVEKPISTEYNSDKKSILENGFVNSKNDVCKNHQTGNRDINVAYGNSLKYGDKCASNVESQTSTHKKFSASLPGTSVKSLPVTKLNNSYSKNYDEFYINQGYQHDFKDELRTYQKEPSKTPLSKVTEKKSAFKSFDIIFDPVFILIALTNALYSAMFICMMTILLDFAKDIGVGVTEEKYVIMSFSVGDLIGRLGFGWVTDDGYMTRSNFAALCFFFQGLTTILITWSSGFYMLMTMAALYGLSEAGLILIIPLIIAEFIEEDKQTVAIPTSHFLSGPLCLAVAPLIGFFRDDVGSYDFIFYGMGVISFMCTLCYLLIPSVTRCRRNR